MYNNISKRKYSLIISIKQMKHIKPKNEYLIDLKLLHIMQIAMQ